MKLEFLFLGKTREQYLAQGIADFSKRLSHYVPAEIKILKDVRRGKKNVSEDKIIALEGEALLGAVARNSIPVVLDVTGKLLTSEEVAGKFAKWEGQGVKNISFLIGGPMGLSPAVLKAANFIWSLSSLTFTHEMARLVLLEQVYRAYTIKAGEKYHK